MLKWRLASALVGIPLLLLATYAGGLWLAALAAALSRLGVEETVRLLAVGPLGGNLARFWAAAAPILTFFWPERWGAVVMAALLTFLGAHAVAAARAADPAGLERLGRSAGAGLLALVYPAFFFTHLVLLGRAADPQGRAFPPLWLVLIAVWAGDTLAYFVGRRFGGRRLAPLASPGKTVSGALAGLGGSLAAGAGLGALWLGSGAAGAVLGAAIGAAGLLGDLFESLLKRAAGVKDSGRLIPGHGGVLDRFDSLVPALPVAYYLLMWFGYAR